VEFTLKVIGGEMTAIPGISDAIEVFFNTSSAVVLAYNSAHYIVEQFKGQYMTLKDTLTRPITFDEQFRGPYVILSRIH
jgi:hypothetical protein